MKPGPLYQSMTALRKGRTLLLNSEGQCQHARDIAKRIGVTITTRKISGEGFRVWRTK